MLHPFSGSLFGDKFKIESDAHGADVYVEGPRSSWKVKRSYDQWLDGSTGAFTTKKKILVWPTTPSWWWPINSSPIWKVDKLPERCSHPGIIRQRPNSSDVVGKENSRRTAQFLKKLKSKRPPSTAWSEWFEGSFFRIKRTFTTESLRDQKSSGTSTATVQGETPTNSSRQWAMKPDVRAPIRAVHCFIPSSPTGISLQRLLKKSNGKISVTG